MRPSKKAVATSMLERASPVDFRTLVPGAARRGTAGAGCGSIGRFTTLCTLWLAGFEILATSRCTVLLLISSPALISAWWIALQP